MQRLPSLRHLARMEGCILYRGNKDPAVLRFSILNPFMLRFNLGGSSFLNWASKRGSFCPSPVQLGAVRGFYHLPPEAGRWGQAVAPASPSSGGCTRPPPLPLAPGRVLGCLLRLHGLQYGFFCSILSENIWVAVIGIVNYFGELSHSLGKSQCLGNTGAVRCGVVARMSSFWWLTWCNQRAANLIWKLPACGMWSNNYNIINKL